MQTSARAPDRRLPTHPIVTRPRKPHAPLPQSGSISTLICMKDSTATSDMPTLMAAVGEVLLCWGYVETAILDRLATIEAPAARPSKASPSSRWKGAEAVTLEIRAILAEIERLADVRNCLAHGLTAASVNPDDAHAPAVTCRTPSGNRHIAFATLLETRRDLHRLSQLIRSLPPHHNERIEPHSR